MTWVVLARRKIDIAILVVFSKYFELHIILCVNGELYQMLVSIICMECYIVSMAMKIIILS